MMGHLVNNCVAKAQHFLGRNWVFKNIKIIEGYYSSILHCSPFVLMCKNLIILAEWVGESEVFLKKLHRFISHLLDERNKFHHVLVETLYTI
jgi:hypothetical protein